jgi:hypothetical protein
MGEAKVFESGDFTVTTERFVYDSMVVPLDDIKFAMPFVNRGWAGMFIIAGIGLAMLAWGGALWKIIGFLLLPGAYGFFHYTIHRRLVLSMNVGESIHINVATTPLLNQLVEAINRAIGNRQGARAAALRSELDSIPSAR